MDSWTKLSILKWFDANDTLVVDLVSADDGYHKTHTFHNADEAVIDIPNLECEYDVYGPW